MATKSDFMAAEEIKAILHGRDKIEQERIIRWVTESLSLAGSPSIFAGVAVPPVAIPAATPAHAQAVGTPLQRSKDIKTFVKERNPKSDVQFAAVAAYFYRFESSPGERKEVILPKDLDEAGRQARGYSFKKARATLNNAVMLGYFDRAGDGQFKLNAVGENLVAMTLPGTSGEANGGKPRRAKRKRKTRVAKQKAK
jgi:hypothetical protein